MAALQTGRAKELAREHVGMELRKIAAATVTEGLWSRQSGVASLVRFPWSAHFCKPLIYHQNNLVFRIMHF